ncbi:thermonuclease family protein [Streptomyces sp. NPDC056468]|uniref:thermonuclease family protein n=1 Tax=Streptomyces sp. NPDC056468 TaxID=3345830 RepID=UPI0036830CF2
MNTYPATLEHQVDGDTYDLNIDVGFGIRVRQRVHLLGLNTLEKRTAEGRAASAWAAQWLERHAAGLVVRTHRREKYGRWLATLMSADGAYLNTALLEAGHAPRTTAPVPPPVGRKPPPALDRVGPIPPIRYIVQVIGGSRRSARPGPGGCAP